MSQDVFTTGDNQTANSESTDTAQTNESFVKQLVETKGANFSDPEVVAKSKLEADAFIANLERQNTELRQDLGKQDYAKDLLTQLQENKATPTTSVNPGESNNNNSSTNSDDGTKLLESGDLASLIDDALAKKDATTKTEANLRVVNSKLEELYGTEADKVVGEKGAALGLSKEYLKTMAADSPQAFFTLIGEEAPKVVNPVGQSTVNTAGAYNQTADRDANYYRNIRKTNPTLYYTPKIQREQVADMDRLGDKFGS